LEAKVQLHRRFDENKSLVVEVSSGIKTAAEIQEILDALRLGEPEAPAPPEKPPVPPPVEVDAEMVVGTAEGRPGGIVDIDVRGGSGFHKVGGFQMNIGLAHRMRLLGIKLGSFFDVLGDKRFEQFGEFVDGRPEPFFTYYLGFFKVGETVETANELIIPENTHLFTAQLQIPEEESPGEKTLYCRDRWFYLKTSESMKKMTAFSSSQHPAGLPTHIDERHGRITVNG
jgi:hypothetical protein